MKRKKTVKTLMGEGIPRNLANRVAATTAKRHMSHDYGTGLFLTTFAMLLNGQDPSCLYPAAGGGDE